MKKIIVLIVSMLFVLTLSGCKNNDEAAEYVYQSSEGVVNYYFASTSKNQTLLNELCAGYNERASKDLANGLHAVVGSVNVLADNISTNAEKNEEISGKTINLGYIRNGKLSYENEDGINGMFARMGHVITSNLRTGSSVKINSVIFDEESEALNELKNGIVDALIGVTECNDADLIYSSVFCTDMLVFYSRFTPSSLTYPTIYTVKEYELQAQLTTKSSNIEICENVDDAVAKFNANEHSAIFGLFSDVVLR